MPGDFNAGKLKTFYLISTSMSRVQLDAEKLLITFIPQTETLSKLSLALHLANLIITILLIPVTNKLKQELPVTRSILKWSDEADAELQDTR